MIDNLIIPAFCNKKHYATLIRDGRVIITGCPYIIQDLHVLEVYPQSDVSACGYIAYTVIKHLENRIQFRHSGFDIGYKHQLYDVWWNTKKNLWMVSRVNIIMDNGIEI